MKKIANFINYLECPSINGIIFPDETVQIIDIEVDWESPINYTIKKISKSSINALSSKGNLNWNDCAIIVNYVDKKHSIEIIAGEGDYGSDGFVGVIDLDSRKLIWLAFFNCSNPFNEIEVVDEEIYAKSTNDCLWKFKIKEPISFVVDCC